jgi:hypothetical protein
MLYKDKLKIKLTSSESVKVMNIGLMEAYLRYGDKPL